MGLPRDRIQHPPRTIQPMLAAQMAFSGAATQIGWLVFGFGSIFFWMFAWHADLTGWRFREGSIANVPGASLGCRDTHYAVGGSDTSRGTPVYENRYRYTVDGVVYEGRSYDTGTCMSGTSTIEYLISQPSYSRIRGMRRGLLSPWALLAALFPMAGLIIVIIELWRARLRIRLLREGLAAEGRVTGRVFTGSRVGGRGVYRITLEYSALDGAHTTCIRTDRPERLEGEEQKTVLYDPADPNRALPIDGLPGDLSLDHAGGILPGASRSFLILPAVSLLLNAWFVYRAL